jgi:integrase
VPKKPRDRDGIYTRPDRPGFWGSWIDSSGRRRRRMFKAHTLTQARALLAAEKARVEKALTLGYVPPTKDTFAQVAARYLKHQKARVKEAEFVRQQGIVNKYLNPFFGALKIADVRRPAVQSYITGRNGDAAPGTIVKELNTLKHLFSMAVEWEIIPLNPAQGVKPPRVPAGRVRYLEPGELRGLMESCPLWLRPIVGLALASGMRRGELLKLRWSDVDVPRGRILLSHTKSGEPRYAYLNKLSHQVIESLAPREQKPTGKLFPSVTPAQVTVAFIRACTAAGIEDFSMHDLRHTAASWMRMKGADIHTIALLLGHKDLRMAARYSHLSPGFLGEAIRTLDDVFTDPLVLEPGDEK